LYELQVASGLEIDADILPAISHSRSDDDDRLGDKRSSQFDKRDRLLPNIYCPHFDISRLHLLLLHPLPIVARVQQGKGSIKSHYASIPNGF
jgi:hypothetical protein